MANAISIGTFADDVTLLEDVADVALRSKVHCTHYRSRLGRAIRYPLLRITLGFLVSAEQRRQHFLQAGDQVVTGPYNSVRGMVDGDLVKVDNKKAK